MEERYKWVDVSKAIAMIFVYLGHWNTQFIQAFAYAFHLQLFFLAAGFFAKKSSERTVKEWVHKQTCSLLFPYFLWVLISFVIKNIDNADFSNADFRTIIVNPSGMQPNYWFFPAFIAVSTAYYLLYKVIKRPVVILIIALILHMFLGEVSIVPAEYNIFRNVDSWPQILRITNSWFSIPSIPTYLFWYSLGAITFNQVLEFADMKNKNPRIFYCTGVVSGILSMILLLKKITGFNSIKDIIYSNTGIFECYKIVCCLIILCFVFFISKLLEESPVLNNIGRSSMNFMGLEYLTHSYFTLSFLPMINLGIPSMTSTMHVVTITIIQVIMNIWISNQINKYLPVLNGDGLRQKVH